MRTFQAQTMREALRTVREACGADAIIVRALERRDGVVVWVQDPYDPPLPPAEHRDMMPLLKEIRKAVSYQTEAFGLKQVEECLPFLKSAVQCGIPMHLASLWHARYSRVIQEQPLPLAWGQILKAECRLRDPSWAAQPHPIAFIGKAGSGKTTALIQLALWIRLQHPRAQIQCIVFQPKDTGVVGVLEHYAQILGFSVTYVHSIASYHVAQAIPSAHTLIEVSDRLQALWHAVPGVATIAVIPADLQYARIRQLLHTAAPIEAIWMTHVAHTPVFGAIIGAACERQLPFSFYSKGPYPRDMAPMTLKVLRSLFLGHSHRNAEWKLFPCGAEPGGLRSPVPHAHEK